MSRPADADADVIVVGAGPSGATAAYHLARSGVSVLMLEKAELPREKVCGDGLTPRAVAQLIKLGIDTSEGNGWRRNKGLRIYGGGMRLHLDWPELGDFPGYGLIRRRLDFDEQLARHAQKAGVELHERCTVTGPVEDAATGRIVGVTARHDGGEEVTYRARVVIAADGNSARLAIARGLDRQDDRPMGVAIRTYFTSPRTDDDWLETWLELWDSTSGNDGTTSRSTLPGYGWIFGMGDGTSNVGLGILNTEHSYGRLDYKALLRRWLDKLPAEWQYTPEFQVGPVRGAALPMGFNRKPVYDRGLLLIGDAAGMVNPFNGEGIAYAMESGEIAADVIASALARDNVAAREMTLARYPGLLADRFGGYYTLGGLFVKLIGNPKVMSLATHHGLPRPLLMKFVLKLLANLYEPRGGDAADRLVAALTKLVPAA
jgi:geranylgeranyl reductase family protein